MIITTNTTADNSDTLIKYIDSLNIKISQQNYSDCLHDSCSNCNGKGFDSFGRACIHYLSCSCKKCSPWSM